MKAYWLYKLRIESSEISASVLSDLGENDSCHMPVWLFLMSGLSFPFYRGCAVSPIVYCFYPFSVAGSATAGRPTRLDRKESENASETDKISGRAPRALYKEIQRSADVESVLPRLPFHYGKHKTDDYEKSSTGY